MTKLSYFLVDVHLTDSIPLHYKCAHRPPKKGRCGKDLRVEVVSTRFADV